MAKITRDQAIAALVEVVQEALARGEEVYVPELGTFRVEHRPSVAEELPDGQIALAPPHDEISFSPQE